MYYIKKSEWDYLKTYHPECIGKSLKYPSMNVIYEGAIPGNNGKGGTEILSERADFLIVKDQDFVSRIIEI